MGALPLSLKERGQMLKSIPFAFLAAFLGGEAATAQTMAF